LQGYGGVHNQVLTTSADESPADKSEPRMDESPDDVLDAVTRNDSGDDGGYKSELRMDESPDDVLDAVTRNNSGDDGGWPPPWTRPVVIGGVLWYSTLFFS
jgi:hypothetical protein